ncbi:MAG TPA: tetratricopeptide repeat protein [Flavitalea sp.]|nr:tetratricopeptide repeat protein [Flavitalea sp.]
MKILCFIFFLLTGHHLLAQDANKLISKGNKEYTAGKFDEALKLYEKAVSKEPGNEKAAYNLANTLYKKKQYEESTEAFKKLSDETKSPALVQHSVYNKGVALTRSNKLEESIEAYKQAVLLDPKDADARHNLQKALLELKKKQPPQKQKENNQQQKQDQKPKQQQSKLNKKQVENLLKALQQKEQDVQKRATQNRSRASSQPEKDW